MVSSGGGAGLYLALGIITVSDRSLSSESPLLSGGEGAL